MRNSEARTVALESGGSVTALFYPAEPPALGASLIFAHGAGAGQRSPFMVSFAQAFAAHGIDVVTFNFLYIEQHRRVPDRRPVLEHCYTAVIDDVRRHVGTRNQRLFIGGKSMGGRMATHVAAADPHLSIAGLVLLGYPLHPPGRPTERRDAHLADVRRPMLVVQGSRDAFGTPSDFVPLLDRLTPRPSLYVVDGGDHSFKLSGAAKTEQQSVYLDVQRIITEWITTTH